jgi:hypothetical protein
VAADSRSKSEERRREKKYPEKTMGLEQWLGEFCKLHEQARTDALPASDRKRYLAARDELATALLKAQRIALQSGEVPRRSLRAALGFAISLQLPGGNLHSITRDLSSGGFSVMLSNAPLIGAVVPFTLKLAAKDSVEGKARLVSLSPISNTRRGSFSFEPLAPEVVERIELLVFDAVVAQLKA